MYVVVNNIAQRRQVTVVQRNGFEAEIQQGLHEGEAIILHPSEHVDHGSRVQPW